MNNEALATLAEKKLETVTGGLKDFRQTHLEVFKKSPLEVKTPEAYKFTNLKTFFGALEYSPYEGEEAKAETYLSDDFHTLVFIDGELQNKITVPGLSIKSVEESFGVVASELKTDHPLSTLHHALLGAGVVLEIEKKTKIEKPIRLVNMITRSGVNAPTILIRAHSFSEATILEENFDQAIAHAFIGETYIHVEAGATLEHVQVSNGSDTALLHTSTHTTLARDSVYRNVILNISGKLNRRNVSVGLLESGAHAESYNLYLTNGSEHSDISSVIHHMAADTTSNQIAKGILDGESKGIFTGKIHIHQHAQRVNSGQINKNLLLSSKANAHSQPQLEIFADDVKCSHGSTTGQLSDDEVFYFQARGIPADKAKTLLAHGFGMEVVLKIENKIVRAKVEELVMNSLKTKFALGGEK